MRKVGELPIRGRRDRRLRPLAPDRITARDQGPDDEAICSIATPHRRQVYRQAT